MTVKAADMIIRFMEKYNRTYRDMVEFLTEKMAKVMADDLVWLMDSTEEEQALIMHIQSDENARIELFKELGLDEKKADEVLEETPEERKILMNMQYDKMVESIKTIRSLNADILETVEKKLSVQEELVRKTGMMPQETYNGYGAKIKKTPANKSFLGSI